MSKRKRARREVRLSELAWPDKIVWLIWLAINGIFIMAQLGLFGLILGGLIGGLVTLISGGQVETGISVGLLVGGAAGVLLAVIGVPLGIVRVQGLGRLVIASTRREEEDAKASSESPHNQP